MLVDFELSNCLLGVLVLAVGILVPLGIAASRNKVLQSFLERTQGKSL